MVEHSIIKLRSLLEDDTGLRNEFRRLLANTPLTEVETWNNFIAKARRAEHYIQIMLWPTDPYYKCPRILTHLKDIKANYLSYPQNMEEKWGDAIRILVTYGNPDSWNYGATSLVHFLEEYEKSRTKPMLKLVTKEDFEKCYNAHRGPRP